MINAKSSREPKISFGIIVLNGEPFIRYCIRQIYPFAHQIIIAEGACSAARSIATPDGHSRDRTLDVIAELRRNEDPEGKIVLVTAEDEGMPDGFWPGEKDQQSRAWAKRATGDYIWQVDADEFYRPEDIKAVMGMLKSDPGIAMVAFSQRAFWGGFDYLLDGWYFRLGTRTISMPQVRVPRISRWGQGFRYENHRPLTVLDTTGHPTHRGKILDNDSLAESGIYLYHYLGVLPVQIEDKLSYYSQADWKKSHVPTASEYRALVFDHVRTNPFRIHFIQEYPSWLERFEGHHPPEIENLRRDLEAGANGVQVRATGDIEALIDSPRYRVIRWFWKQRIAVEPALAPWRRRLRTYLGDGPQGLVRGIQRLRNERKRGPE